MRIGDSAAISGYAPFYFQAALKSGGFYRNRIDIVEKQFDRVAVLRFVHFDYRLCNLEGKGSCGKHVSGSDGGNQVVDSSGNGASDHCAFIGFPAKQGELSFLSHLGRFPFMVFIDVGVFLDQEPFPAIVYGNKIFLAHIFSPFTCGRSENAFQHSSKNRNVHSKKRALLPSGRERPFLEGMLGQIKVIFASEAPLEALLPVPWNPAAFIEGRCPGRPLMPQKVCVRGAFRFEKRRSSAGGGTSFESKYSLYCSRKQAKRPKFL
jgi:hypothetical protein